jgi:hypothetical protein
MTSASASLEIRRMHAALKTYLDTDPNLRYVALVGSFSSGKTATINNLFRIGGTDQAREEDINPVDDKLTLCELHPVLLTPA